MEQLSSLEMVYIGLYGTSRSYCSIRKGRAPQRHISGRHGRENSWVSCFNFQISCIICYWWDLHLHMYTFQIVRLFRERMHIGHFSNSGNNMFFLVSWRNTWRMGLLWGHMCPFHLPGYSLHWGNRWLLFTNTSANLLWLYTLVFLMKYLCQFVHIQVIFLSERKEKPIYDFSEFKPLIVYNDLSKEFKTIV